MKRFIIGKATINYSCRWNLRSIEIELKTYSNFAKIHIILICNSIYYIQRSSLLYVNFTIEVNYLLLDEKAQINCCSRSQSQESKTFKSKMINESFEMILTKCFLSLKESLLLSFHIYHDVFQLYPLPITASQRLQWTLYRVRTKNWLLSVNNCVNQSFRKTIQENLFFPPSSGNGWKGKNDRSMEKKYIKTKTTN